LDQLEQRKVLYLVLISVVHDGGGRALGGAGGGEDCRFEEGWMGRIDDVELGMRAVVVDLLVGVIGRVLVG
jgi:hypothetical protein